MRFTQRSALKPRNTRSAFGSNGHSRADSTSNPDLRSAMHAAGLAYAGPLEPDGELHRIKVDGDHDKNSWYVLHESGNFSAAAFGCWKRDIKRTWNSCNGRALSSDEHKELRRIQAEQAALRAAEEARLHGEASAKIQELIAKSSPATEHDYLTRKGIKAHGRLLVSVQESTKGWLMLPLQDANGTIHSAQFIAEDGAKKFLYGGRVAGCFFPLADKSDGPLVVCEGYATGASIHESTSRAVVCAMNCGNLLAVAKAMRAKWPDREIILAGDQDQFTEDNPGLSKATEAAKAIKAHVAVPEFSDESLGEKPTDFNDLHRLAGLDEVRRQIERANPVARVLVEREFNPRIQPPPVRAIYTLLGCVICTPGNLTTITSAVKTGKSAAIGAMAAAAMDEKGTDMLGFKSRNPECHALLWFDSEQSPDDFWHCVRRAIQRAGLKAPPPWLYAYRLKGLDCKKAWQCVIEATRRAAEHCRGVHSILIDGTADLVTDVNDPLESNSFVVNLDDLSVSYDCPVAGVIHFNPGSEKSRGHLGSQLERKAESNLILEKDEDDVTVIYATKNRRAPIPKAAGPRFAWSDQAGMHVTVGVQQTTKGRELAELVQDIFAMENRQAMRFSELVSALQKHRHVSERTAERRIRAAVNSTVIKKTVAGLWVTAS